eukprot:tig00020800_g13734.t1
MLLDCVQSQSIQFKNRKPWGRLVSSQATSSAADGPSFLLVDPDRVSELVPARTGQAQTYKTVKSLPKYRHKFTSTCASADASFFAGALETGELLLWNRRQDNVRVVPTPYDAGSQAEGGLSAEPSAGQTFFRRPSPFAKRLAANLGAHRVVISDDGKDVLLLGADNRVWLWTKSLLAGAGSASAAVPAADSSGAQWVQIPADELCLGGTQYEGSQASDVPSFSACFFRNGTLGRCLVASAVSISEARQQQPAYPGSSSGGGVVSGLLVTVRMLEVTCRTPQAQAQTQAQQQQQQQQQQPVRTLTRRTYLPGSLDAPSSRALPGGRLPRQPSITGIDGDMSAAPDAAAVVSQWDCDGSTLAVVVNSSPMIPLVFVSPFHDSTVAVPLYPTFAGSSPNTTGVDRSLWVSDLCWTASGLFVTVINHRGYVSVVSRVGTVARVLLNPSEEPGPSPVVPLQSITRGVSRNTSAKVFSISAHPSEPVVYMCDGYTCTPIELPAISYSLAISSVREKTTVTDMMWMLGLGFFMGVAHPAPWRDADLPAALRANVDGLCAALQGVSAQSDKRQSLGMEPAAQMEEERRVGVIVAVCLKALEQAGWHHPHQLLLYPLLSLPRAAIQCLVQMGRHRAAVYVLSALESALKERLPAPTLAPAYSLECLPAALDGGRGGMEGLQPQYPLIAGCLKLFAWWRGICAKSEADAAAPAQRSSSSSAIGGAVLASQAAALASELGALVEAQNPRLVPASPANEGNGGGGDLGALRAGHVAFISGQRQRAIGLFQAAGPRGACPLVSAYLATYRMAEALAWAEERLEADPDLANLQLGAGEGGPSKSGLQPSQLCVRAAITLLGTTMAQYFRSPTEPIAIPAPWSERLASNLIDAPSHGRPSSVRLDPAEVERSVSGLAHWNVYSCARFLLLESRVDEALAVCLATNTPVLTGIVRVAVDADARLGSPPHAFANPAAAFSARLREELEACVAGRGFGRAVALLQTLDSYDASSSSSKTLLSTLGASLGLGGPRDASGAPSLAASWASLPPPSGPSTARGPAPLPFPLSEAPAGLGAAFRAVALEAILHELNGALCGISPSVPPSFHLPARPAILHVPPEGLVPPAPPAQLPPLDPHQKPRPDAPETPDEAEIRREARPTLQK